MKLRLLDAETGEILERWYRDGPPGEGYVCRVNGEDRPVVDVVYRIEADVLLGEPGTGAYSLDPD
jgi:hypothetical protein